MVWLLITKQDLEFLILAATSERRHSEDVGVPLCRSEIACLAKLYRARDKAYGREVGDGEWKKEIQEARTFEGMGEAFVERYMKAREADVTKPDPSGGAKGGGSPP